MLFLQISEFFNYCSLSFVLDPFFVLDWFVVFWFNCNPNIYRDQCFFKFLRIAKFAKLCGDLHWDLSETNNFLIVGIWNFILKSGNWNFLKKINLLFIRDRVRDGSGILLRHTTFLAKLSQNLSRKRFSGQPGPPWRKRPNYLYYLFIILNSYYGSYYEKLDFF